MKRFCILFISLLAAVPLLAQQTNMQLLKRLAGYVKSLGRYEASFVLHAGDYSTTGRFLVDGDSYYMSVGDAEVYSDGKVRYEVDRQRKEVNIDVVDVDSRNILDNPTRCFDFVGSDYRSNVVSSDKEKTVLQLDAIDENIEGQIRIFMESASGKPCGVEYVLGDESVEVGITAIGSSKLSVKQYRQADYRDYEIIDFR